jgi:DUF177 domain-containing protein
MAPRLDRLDLSTLGLAAGAGRRLETEVEVGELDFGGERYAVDPDPVPATLEISRLSGPGFALRLRLACVLRGPCMRCLKDAAMPIEVDAREVEAGAAAGAGRREQEEELASPYVAEEVLDLRAWARDALVLGLPAKILCREDCPGLCPVCAADLSEVGEDHSHAGAPDPRWAKLRELRLD